MQWGSLGTQGLHLTPNEMADATFEFFRKMCTKGGTVGHHQRWGGSAITALLSKDGSEAELRASLRIQLAARRSNRPLRREAALELARLSPCSPLVHVCRPGEHLLNALSATSPLRHRGRSFHACRRRALSATPISLSLIHI